MSTIAIRAITISTGTQISEVAARKLMTAWIAARVTWAAARAAARAACRPAWTASCLTRSVASRRAIRKARSRWLSWLPPIAAGVVDSAPLEASVTRVGRRDARNSRARAASVVGWSAGRSDAAEGSAVRSNPSTARSPDGLGRPPPRSPVNRSSIERGNRCALRRSSSDSSSCCSRGRSPSAYCAPLLVTPPRRCRWGAGCDASGLARVDEATRRSSRTPGASCAGSVGVAEDRVAVATPDRSEGCGGCQPSSPGWAGHDSVEP